MSKNNKKILSGIEASKQILSYIKEEVDAFEKKPKLAIILVGEDESSKIYVNKKIEDSKKVGILTVLKKFDKDIKEDKLINEIIKLNEDEKVHGILVQLPLPTQIKKENVFKTIVPWKDVDSFNPYNKGLLEINDPQLISPTALSAFSFIESQNIDVKGKNIVIIGKGDITAKPLNSLLVNRGATITICDEYTRDISYFTKKADIIFTCVGKRDLLKLKDIKKGSILINIGITKENGNIYGDFDYKKMLKKASMVTQTPGGTGPMTVAYLLLNVIKCYKIIKGEF